MTATTWPLSISPVTNAYLSSGLDLASTDKCGTILSNYSPLAIVSTLNLVPFSLAVFHKHKHIDFLYDRIYFLTYYN